jgi:lysophospholipid acyltransferase 1/2
LYLKLFMCLHLTAALTVFVLPKLIRGNVSSSDKKTSSCVTSKTLEELPKNCEDVATEQKKKEVVSAMRMQNSENGPESEESSNSNSSCSSFSNSMNDVSDKNHQRKTDTKYLLKDLINKEVNKIKGETDNLSSLLMEKIEAANIEGLIDKAVTGVVELKDDLMRMNEPEVYSGGATDGLRKRNLLEKGLEVAAANNSKSPDGVDTFLKKEIDAIKEANVIPAVLSNGHAK